LKIVRRNSFFILSVLLFLGHYLIQLRWSIPVLHAYFDDLLAPPIVLGLALRIFQGPLLSDAHFRFSWPFLLHFILFISIWFEWLMPQMDSRHTADAWDCLVYALGLGLFCVFDHKPQGTFRVFSQKRIEKCSIGKVTF